MNHLKSSCPVVFFLLMMSAVAQAQAPSDEMLTLSLRTMNKALVACKESYSVPLVKSTVGVENYNKDMKSLNMALKLSDFLIAHPNQVTGKTLVAILSTADDFQVGVGSTRFLALSASIQGTIKADMMMALITSLTDCQKGLFNAGDDYVGLTLGTVGAEDDALVAISKKLPGGGK
jgi:hypothetical protein